MKQRIISAIIALLICIPIIIYGELPFYIGASIIGVVGYYELLKAKNKKREIPYLMKVISIFCFLFIMIENLDFIADTQLEYINSEILSFILLLVPVVFYSSKKTYNIEDALFLLGGALFLGKSFNLLINVRISNLSYLFFLLLITIFTDTFALITGMLIGRNKLCPKVSPKKTWEGFIGGSIFGTFIGTMFYITAFNYTKNIIPVILIVFILSVAGQLGDLVFSSIKRHFDIKDFGNIMPGHGGVLDRLDSILLVMLAFSLFARFI